MSEQAHITDMERALQADLETVVGKVMLSGILTHDELALLAWACGVNLSTVETQEQYNAS